MGRPLLDITGRTFGFYTVLQRHSAYAVKPVMWLCRCKCGVEKPVRSQLLLRGLKGGTGCSTCVRDSLRGATPSGKNARVWGSTEEKFWARVVKGETPDACWGWLGGHDGAGRPMLRYRSRETGKTKLRRAYQVSYELHYGPVNDGLEVCHKCNNPGCSNPLHLYAGTRRDNWGDSVEAATYVVGRRGSDHPCSKLTEESVRDILMDPRPYMEIAECYEVQASLISGIKSRRRYWKHVKVPYVVRCERGTGKKTTVYEC